VLAAADETSQRHRSSTFRRASGLRELMERHLTDSRREKNKQLPLADHRQSVVDWPGMKMSTTPSTIPRIRPSGSSAPGRFERGAALPRVATVRDEVLTQADNLGGLASSNRSWWPRPQTVHLDGLRWTWTAPRSQFLRPAAARRLTIRPLRVYLLSAAPTIQWKRRLPRARLCSR
jgi:hypothetical protein